MTVHEGVVRDVFRLFVWFPLRWMISDIPVNIAFFIFVVMSNFHFWTAGKKDRGLIKYKKSYWHRQENYSKKIL